MIIENSNKREQPPSINDQVMDTIEETLKGFEGDNSKEFLISNLNNIYGVRLTEKVISSLPDEFFNTKKIEEKETVILPTESGTAKSLSGMEKLSEEEKERKAFEILEKEYKIPKAKIEEFKISRNWKVFFKMGMIAIPIAIATLLIKNKEKIKEVDKKIDKKEIVVEKKENKKESSINFNERFDVEFYNSLSDDGRDVYKTMAEKDPTPGKYYQILDKDRALIYVFNSENKLTSSFPAGFGKDQGDEPNTSEEYNKGKNTTPAGIYLLSNTALPKDIQEYGELQYSLYGISVLGDKIFLGEHQTYSNHGELDRRTKKLNTNTPDDNNFTDGCLNTGCKNISEFIKPYFKGDYSEIMFILPDKKSRESGAIFDPNDLIRQIIPLMLEMTTKEEKIYEEYTIQTRDSINKFVEEISVLKNKHSNLIKESRADSRNEEKQIKIAIVKNEINQKKNLISEGRKILSDLEKKSKELSAKRQNIERMVIGEN